MMLLLLSRDSLESFKKILLVTYLRLRMTQKRLFSGLDQQYISLPNDYTLVQENMQFSDNNIQITFYTRSTTTAIKTRISPFDCLMHDLLYLSRQVLVTKHKILCLIGRYIEFRLTLYTRLF